MLVDSVQRIFATVPSRPKWLTEDMLDGVDAALDRFEKKFKFSNTEQCRKLQRSAHYGNNFGGGRMVRDLFLF